MSSHPFSVDVSVVLPCLNEAESVAACVTAAYDAMRAAGYRGEVVVADNGSTDGSQDLALAAGARVVHQPVRGYGAALQAGFAAAQGTVVVMADADCTYPLEKIAELVQPVLDGDADMMIGSRLDEATRKSMPFLHRFVGTPTLTYLVRRASGSGLRLTDSQSGFRAMRRDAVQGLGLHGTGMEFASELIIRAVGAGWRVKEVPTGYRERVGESKLDTFSDGWRHLRLILSLAPHLLLVGPGVVAGVLGVALTVLSLIGDHGFVTVGSTQWQPSFLSPMLLVLSVCALLTGGVLAHKSVLLHDSVRAKYAFIGHPRFPMRCTVAGVVSVLLGISLNVALVIAEIAGRGAANRRLAIAGVAQAGVLAGILLIAFGVLYSLVSTGSTYTRGAAKIDEPEVELPKAAGLG